MKKHLHNSLRALFLSLAVLLSLPMLAEEVEIDGINYDLNAETKQAAVVRKSTGTYSGEVVVPESVEHEGVVYSVTSIGELAFWGCSRLTSVTIGNSVTSIGGNAFRDCSRLTSVTIGNSVKSIGRNAFSGCSGLTSVHISDIVAWCNIDFIDNTSNPLYNAHHLYLDGEEVKDLVIPNSVTNIGEAGFVGCSGLTSVTIPNSVTSIGWGAFKGCSGLTSVTIGNSVTSIGTGAFWDCSGLTSVTIPNSVTSIGMRAFYGCYFGGSNFVNNSSLSAEENDYWEANIVDYETQDGLLIDSTSVIFCRKSAVIVTIPNSVTSIREFAFNGCSGLTSVTIGNSVTSIGENAFRNCMLQTIVCKAIKPAVMGGNGISSTNMYNHTQLYVPEGAYWDYAFSDWGSFIRIKEMAMDTEDLESRKAYMIADATGRNFSVYDSTKGDLVNIAYTHSLDEESEGTCWTVLKEGNASYLYNIGSKKYGAIAEDGALTLSDAPVGVDIVSTENGLSINGKSCMFVLNNNISFDATGITETENGKVKSENSAVYDLSGRRVQKAQKGVFIQKGKVIIQ